MYDFIPSVIWGLDISTKNYAVKPASDYIEKIIIQAFITVI